MKGRVPLMHKTQHNMFKEDTARMKKWMRLLLPWLLVLALQAITVAVALADALTSVRGGP